MGGTGAPAGATGDAGAGAVAAEFGGAGVTGGTGSGLSGVGSLPAFSLGASTFAVSDLPDSPSDFAA